MPARALRLRLPLALLPLAAFLAILPLLVSGPSCGHDFTFHLTSWFEAANQFAHGTYPEWANTPAYGAGEPRFVFYPPLSWALGALLGLVLPWTLVPAAFTWIALTLSGYTSYRLARHYAAVPAALVAATLYLANPYMLFTAYERNAYGELLAAAVLPLLFQAALGSPKTRPSQPIGQQTFRHPSQTIGQQTFRHPSQTICHPSRSGGPASVFRLPPQPSIPSPVLSIALPIALLWLTNAPAAVMACYALAFFATLQLIRSRGERLRLALTTSAGTVLGLMLAAFYIVPAAYERRYVQSDMALVDGMRIADSTLFHHMPFSPDSWYHDQVVHTASLIALTLLAAIATALVVIRRRNAQPSPPLPPSPLLPILGLTLLVAFLLTPLSLPLWAHTPELRFLQFPWRLMLLLAPALVILVALALGRHRVPSVVSLLLAAALILPAWHLFHQRCELKDAIPTRLALFRSTLGTEPTDEYTPLAADNDSLHPEDPPYWLIPSPDSYDWRNAISTNKPPPANAAPGPAPNHLVVNLPTPGYLVLNRRKFPTWEIFRNGKPFTDDQAVRRYLSGESPTDIALPERDDGLITLLLPAGTSTIDLVLIRTPDQNAGLALSTLAALIALAFWRRQRRVLPDGPTARGAVTS